MLDKKMGKMMGILRRYSPSDSKFRPIDRTKRPDPSADYQPVHDPRLLRDCFDALAESCLEVSAKAAIRERGMLDLGVRYFFIQRLSSKGLLFFIDGLGWKVCFAEKNVATGSFFRDFNLEEDAELFHSSEGMFRVNSQGMGTKMIGWPVYLEAIKKSVKIYYESGDFTV